MAEHQQQQLPLLLIHRIPNFGDVFKSQLLTGFRLLDPLDSPDPLHLFLDTHAQSVRAVLCLGPSPLKSDTLSRLPALECIVVSGVGLDQIDLTECRRRGIAVTNAGESFSEDVADYAVALLIAVLRKIPAGDRYVRDGLWAVNGDFPLGYRVGGKRVGIVGLGSIGSLVAKRLHAFGCIVAYNSRKEKPHMAYTFYSNVLDLATNSDFLVLCCALTDKPRHIINKDVMRALGKRGVIINVGRGALIDEKELVESLVQGELGGAGLDVFEHEPSVPEELFELDNVVMSPHRAVLTPESIAAVEELVLANLEAFFSNKPLLSPIHLE